MKNVTLVLIFSFFIGCGSDKGGGNSDNSTNLNTPVLEENISNENSDEVSDIATPPNDTVVIIDNQPMDNSDSLATRDFHMIINKSYRINKGDSILKLTPNTKLKVIKNSNKTFFEVKLLTGEAKVIKAK